MKLKEEAFMVNLINASYRRRMIIFVVNIAVVLISAVFLFSYVLKPEMPDLKIILALPVFVVSAGNLVYCIEEEKDPWFVKKAQIKALKEQSDAKADFEDLRCNVPLREYFL